MLFQQRKAWQRFREIPDYIESESAVRNVSPRVILDELEKMRIPEVGTVLKGISALSAIVKDIRLKRKHEEKLDMVRALSAT